MHTGLGQRVQRSGIAGQQHHLRAVAGLELLHDVPDMNLDGALAQVELKGDYLILLALSQLFQYRQFTHRKLDLIGTTSWTPHRSLPLTSRRKVEHARRNVASAAAHKADRS